VELSGGNRVRYRDWENALRLGTPVEEITDFLMGDMSGFGPKAKPEHVRLHVGYWGDERNCYEWDQSVAVDPICDIGRMLNKPCPRSISFLSGC
jgi:hypothetical protein